MWPSIIHHHKFANLICIALVRSTKSYNLLRGTYHVSTYMCTAIACLMEDRFCQLLAVRATSMRLGIQWYLHLRGKTNMLLLLFVVYTIADTLVLAFDFFFIIWKKTQGQVFRRPNGILDIPLYSTHARVKAKNTPLNLTLFLDVWCLQKRESEWSVIRNRRSSQLVVACSL